MQQMIESFSLQSAASLYFVISDLSKLNNRYQFNKLYQFSLSAFQGLFQKALQIKVCTHYTGTSMDLCYSTVLLNCKIVSHLR